MFQFESKDVDKVRAIPNEFAQYIGKCEYCEWGKDEETCTWTDKYWEKAGEEFRENTMCINKSRWRPSGNKIPRLCGSCEHSNCFIYDTKPEYQEKINKSWNHYCSKAAYDPLETPNIYCDREGGSVNRQQPFLDYYEHNFGVGHWNRQHELDTCDAWEKER